MYDRFILKKNLFKTIFWRFKFFGICVFYYKNKGNNKKEYARFFGILDQSEVNGNIVLNYNS